MTTSRLHLFLWAALCAVALPSCSSDEPSTPDPIEISNGVFVLNQGSMSANLPGTLTYCDYAKGSATQSAFASANGGNVLGDTPQDALSYGTKLYVAVYQSNLIRVIDRSTLKILKDIRPTAEQGSQPRYLAAADGKVYASMYDGYAVRIDTASMAIDASVKVGPNPDGVAVYNGNLYVANSDGMNYLEGYANGKTLSQIDLKSFTETRKIEVGLNPGAVAATETGLCFITRGNYSDIPTQMKRLKSDGTAEVIATASLICSNANTVYFINAPWGGDPVSSVGKFDTTTGQTSYVSIEAFDFPAAIGVDPITGDIIITAYNESYGVADYSGPGYACRFNAQGQKVATYTVGVNPCALTFNTTFIPGSGE